MQGIHIYEVGRSGYIAAAYGKRGSTGFAAFGTAPAESRSQVFAATRRTGAAAGARLQKTLLNWCNAGSCAAANQTQVARLSMLGAETTAES
eukprot:1918080-Pleurochrysis_carterae.AAC.4